MKTLLAWLPVALITATIFAGCLSDDITLPDVKPRLVQQPAFVFYKSLTGNDLQVRWTRSVSDTQLNFKGYFIRLYTSQPYAANTDPSAKDSTLIEIDSAHAGKGDTSYTFKNIPLGRYTAEVFGERFPSDTAPSVVVLSQYSQYASFDHDPRDVAAPDSIFASSGSSASIVNLFWTPSKSESQVGMAGYILRYRDTTSNSTKVIEIPGGRFQKIDSAKIPLIRFTVQIPVGNTAPLEKPYKFWIKAIRKDSVESTDSIGISWSGAERLPIGSLSSFKLDTGIFVGQVGTIYNMQEVEVGKAENYFSFHFDGSALTVNASNGTKFVNQIDSSSDLDVTNYFSRPFDDAEFSVTSLTLPSSPASGAVFYVLFPNGSRARVLVGVQQGNTFIRSDNMVSLSASFQPYSPIYRLPYF
jgi:hypothetical protein